MPKLIDLGSGFVQPAGFGSRDMRFNEPTLRVLTRSPAERRAVRSHSRACRSLFTSSIIYAGSWGGLTRRFQIILAAKGRRRSDRRVAVPAKNFQTGTKPFHLRAAIRAPSASGDSRISLEKLFLDSNSVRASWTCRSSGSIAWVMGKQIIEKCWAQVPDGSAPPKSR